MYTKAGTHRRVARELWRRVIAWVGRGKPSTRPVLTRDELRAKINLPLTQEPAFKDALTALRNNLRILGNHPRPARPVGARATEPYDRYDVGVDEVACTFDIAGTPHLVRVFGPTGNDRPDGQRNSLWLEPKFKQLANIAPVLVTPGFSDFSSLGFNYSTAVAAGTDGAHTFRLASAKRELVAAMNGMAFALNGPEGIAHEPERCDMQADEIRVESQWVEGPEWGFRVAGTLATTENDGVWRVAFFGMIPVAPDDRQQDARSRLTSTLDASAPDTLEAVSLEFFASEHLHLRREMLGEALLRMSYPVVAAAGGSPEFLVADGIHLYALCDTTRAGSYVSLHFTRVGGNGNMWMTMRSFDTSRLIREVMGHADHRRS